MHVNEHDKCRFDLVAIHLFCTRCGIDISTGTVTFKAKLVTETAAVEMKPVAFESRAPVVERVHQGRTPGYRQASFLFHLVPGYPSKPFKQIATKDVADAIGGPICPTSASHGGLSTQGTDLGVEQL